MNGLMLPGPALDARILEWRRAYDKADIARRSVSCRDRDGAPLQNPPSLLYGAHDNWLHEWVRLKLRHARECLHHGQRHRPEQPHGPVAEAHGTPSAA